MAETLTFRSWRRPAVAELVSGVAGGRSTAELSLTLEGRDADDAPTSDATRTLTFQLAGPRDVDGLHPDAVTRRYPTPGVGDAETTMCPYVEFTEPSLPWLHTPAPKPSEEPAPRPWLVLVVGSDEEIQPGGGQAALLASVCAAHPLDASHRWAHLQEADGTVLARVLSPRPLEGKTDYVAALVAAYRWSDGTSAPAWNGNENVVVACYDHWRFRTGPAGDFRSLARRLGPYVAGPDAGRSSVDYPRLADAPTLDARGALAPVGSTEGPLPDEIADDLGDLATDATDSADRPVIGLPRYGDAWTDPDGTAWGATLNSDPRHRGVAGLGARVAAEEQEPLAEEVGRQAGALDAASQRIRDLRLGTAVGGSLWRRRVPDDDARQLALFGPALRRVVTDAGTLAARATADGRPLPAGWFSTAARRALRRGPARTALAADGAADPANMLDAANACPDPEPFAELGIPSMADLRAPDFDERLGGHREDDERAGARVLADTLAEQGFRRADELGTILERLLASGEPVPWTAVVRLVTDAAQAGDDKDAYHELEGRLDELIGDLRRIGERREELLAFARQMTEPAPEPPDCTPVDVANLAEAARRALDPTGEQSLSRKRVLDAIHGLDPDQPLAPPEFCPGLDVPTWRMLADRQPDWLLPGLGETPDDSVQAAETNPAFTDALLLGLNTQLVSELRWRNLAIGSGCTPVRTFWNRVDPADGERVDDLYEVGVWDPDGDLGAPDLRAPAAAGGELVLVVRGQLFLRYPQTIVYLVPDDDGDPDLDAAPILPGFRGRIRPDVTFVGFPEVPASDVAAYWLVLEEPPSGFRFRNENPPAGSAVDAAEFAVETFAQPVRVLMSGDRLVGEGPT